MAIFEPYRWYVPQIACDYCYRALNAVKNGDTRHPMKYVRPTIWFDVLEHIADECYFCKTHENAKVFNYRYDCREKIKYADVENVVQAKIRSAEFPKSPYEFHLEQQAEQVAHELALDVGQQQDDAMNSYDDDAPFNNPTTATDMSAIPSTSTGEQTTSEYVPSHVGVAAIAENVPHLITQSDYNDLIREIKISYRDSEILGSRLKEWNLVAPDFRITAYRKRQHTVNYDAMFSYNEAGNIAYCNNIVGLFALFNFTHDPNEWRLFIDGSTKSLKAVLLHIGNVYPSVPVVYAINTKETYEVMEEILDLLNYETFGWRICCDLKVVGLLTGLKKGYPKHSCFLCLWEVALEHSITLIMYGLPESLTDWGKQALKTGRLLQLKKSFYHLCI